MASSTPSENWPTSVTSPTEWFLAQSAAVHVRLHVQTGHSVKAQAVPMSPKTMWRCGRCAASVACVTWLVKWKTCVALLPSPTR